jgi:zinc transport system substrate-binding protein
MQKIQIIKQAYFILVITISSVVIVSCSQNQSPNNSLKIATSIFPIYSITQQIAGDNITVNLLMESGESPHTFTPTISTKKIIERSDRIYLVNKNIDLPIFKIIEDESKVLILSKNIAQRIPKENDEKHNEYEHKDDPHYWLHPNNASQIARNITDDLKQIDPKNSQVYESNFEDFKNEINNLYPTLKTDIAKISDRPFLVMHNGWSYFQEAFEINLIGAFEPYGGESPTPKYLASLQNLVSDQNVVAIFSEPQLSINSIRQFIKDNNLRTGVLDPIGGIEGRMSYQELMKYNIDTLVKTLQ